MRALLRDALVRILRASLDYLEESKERQDQKKETTESVEGDVPWSDTLEGRGKRKAPSAQAPRSREKKLHRRKNVA